MAALIPEQGSEAFLKAPPYLRQVLGFPYVAGMEFSLALQNRGGKRLLNYAYSNPPSSTEQILHPEKWLDERDEPVVFELPDLSSRLGNRSRVLAGDLGELTVRIMLSRASSDRAANVQAAKGWGGDRFAFYRHNAEDPGMLAWITEWDSELDAQEAQAALSTAFTDLPTALDGKRVAAVFGATQDEAAGVLPILLSAPGHQSQAPNIDLAAIGITEADLPGELSPQELSAVFNDPVMQSLLSENLGSEASEMLKAMAADPELAELTLEVGRKILSSDSSDLGQIFEEVEFSKILATPAGQRLAQRLAAQMDPLEATVDGLTFRTDDGGFQLTLPESESHQWQTQIAPGQATSQSKPQMGPGPLWQVTDSKSRTSVTIVGMRAPLPAPLEATVGGAKSENLGNAETISEAYGKHGEERFWQRRVQIEQQATNLTLVQRIYVLDRDFITVMIVYPLHFKHLNPVAHTILQSIQLEGSAEASETVDTLPGGPDDPKQVGGDVTKPEKVHAPQPAYPEDARSERIQGVVILQAVIRRDGTVDPDLNVLSSPDPRLSEAAKATVRSWEFKPATQGGEPVDVYYNLTINFRLEKKDE